MIQQRTADLRRSEERFDMAASAAGIGIWDLDLSNERLHWDDRMLELYGIGAAEFDGSIPSWEARVHPEDLEHAVLEYVEALRGEKPYDTEFRIIRPSGEVRYIKAYAKMMLDENGNPARMIGANLDVTETKMREERITLQLEELNRWQNVIVGREHRVIELKDEVNRLLEELQQPPRYGNPDENRIQ